MKGYTATPIHTVITHNNEEVYLDKVLVSGECKISVCIQMKAARKWDGHSCHGSYNHANDYLCHLFF